MRPETHALLFFPNPFTVHMHKYREKDLAMIHSLKAFLLGKVRVNSLKSAPLGFMLLKQLHLFQIFLALYYLIRPEADTSFREY